MKLLSTFKKYLPILLLILVALLVIKLLQKKETTSNNVADIIELDKKPPTITKDKSGRSHSEKEILYVTRTIANEVYEKQIDSLKDQLKIKDRQLQGVTTGTSEGTTRFIPVITREAADSIRKAAIQNIAYTSKWFDLYGTTEAGKKWDLTVRDSITVAFTRKGGFLGIGDKSYVDMSSANPVMQFKSVRSWEIPSSAQSHWKLGFSIGAGAQYNIQENKVTLGPQVGIGLNYNF